MDTLQKRGFVLVLLVGLFIGIGQGKVQAGVCEKAVVDLKGQEPLHRQPLNREKNTNSYPIKFEIKRGKIRAFVLTVGAKNYGDASYWLSDLEVCRKGMCKAGSVVEVKAEINPQPPTKNKIKILLQFYDPCKKKGGHVIQWNKGPFKIIQPKLATSVKMAPRIPKKEKEGMLKVGKDLVSSTGTKEETISWELSVKNGTTLSGKKIE